jgi:hypothetical protein
MEMAVNATTPKDVRITPPPPALVAAAGWAVPGLGYWFVGQRGRGVVIGVTVVTLFVLGLLIGGVRVLEVPTFSRFGESVPAGRDTTPQYVWREIQAKPWTVPQFMAGPIAIAGGAASVRASRVPDEPGARAPGAESHARINEIAVLYTAVAGMLNLLAMIDAAHRAHKLLEGK